MKTLPQTLPDWLALLESRHAETEINMGLERVSQVRQRLAIEFSCPVITVGGTNGKGSTCAMLESILMQAGYKTGLYIKPHFLSFNERARLNGEMASDEALVASFEAVEAQRGDLALTYFEFTTLAIMHLMAQAKLDVAILEVGLGGRLDAVNVIDADVAVVTSIDIDHIEYLGDTRDAIGFEKAGIFRSGKVAICSDPMPPKTLMQHAESIGAELWLLGRDFNFTGDKQQWNYLGPTQRRNGLAYPALRGANQLLNASAALATLEALRAQLPVSAQEIRNGFALVDLPGRFQILPGRPVVILDVAHNPHAAATLAQNLDNMGFYRYTYAVFGAMHDKDINGVIAHLKTRIDHWRLTDLPAPRGASANALRQRLVEAGIDAGNRTDAERSIETFTGPAEAFASAMSDAGENDRIVVFGSLRTVAGVMAVRKAIISIH